MVDTLYLYIRLFSKAVYIASVSPFHGRGQQVITCTMYTAHHAHSVYVYVSKIPTMRKISKTI